MIKKDTFGWHVNLKVECGDVYGFSNTYHPNVSFLIMNIDDANESVD
jgi:hypothetical protein